MEPVKILIVEDELVTAKRIKGVLEKKGYIITAIANTGEKAMKAMEKECADLVIMDICLKGNIEGINTAKIIKKDYPTSIIYITELADEEIFQNAKETFPKNYISKPFSDETITHAVELAMQFPENIIQEHPLFDSPGLTLSDRIFVQTKEGLCVKLLLTDILYVHSKGSYSFLFFEGARSPQKNFYYFSQSSNRLVERLQFPALIKVHKSYYVNVIRIESIKDAEVFIQGTDVTIPISRDFRIELDKKLKYLKHNPVQK